MRSRHPSAGVRSLHAASLVLSCLSLLGVHAQASAVDTTADGRVLFATLGCPGCHAELDIETSLRSALPDLSYAGMRYRPSYLFAYLQDPVSVRRHLGAARMPAFHLSEAEALALALFLADEQREPQRAASIGEGGHGIDPDQGLTSPEAFEKLAIAAECQSCHTYRGNGGSFAPALDGMGARLQGAWMRRFLAAPAAFDVPDGVMPALFLRPDHAGKLREVRPGAARELAQIVDYLEREAVPERTRLDRAFAAARERHPEASAEGGRQVFLALNCAACHPHDRIEPWRDAAPDLRHEGRVRAGWLRGYLEHPYPVRPFGGRPGSGSRMPDFRLTPDEAASLATFLLQASVTSEPAENLARGGVGPTPLPVEPPPGTSSPRKAASPAALEEPRPGSLSAYRQAKARRLLEQDLSCLGCHALEGSGGRIAPDLSDTAARLRPEAVERMLADPASAVPGTIMPKPALSEDTRALVLAYLLEQDKVRAPRGYLSLTEHATLRPDDGDPRAADYRDYCAPCHGAQGQGDGFNAAYLDVPPTRHADPVHLARRADDTLFDGIHAGGRILGKSHRMPAWGDTLSVERIDGLVKYMRELCACEGPAWQRTQAKQSAR